MLTNQDIKKLIIAFREEFVTKTEFQEFKNEVQQNFSILHDSIDNVLKKMDTFNSELI